MNSSHSFMRVVTGIFFWGGDFDIGNCSLGKVISDTGFVAKCNMAEGIKVIWF